ncbi:MAG: hypothetical protein KBC33_02150 [Candidatus Pacebacteria bacterium]|nr:hypothetical protein [Candidatus Paceibacterota bacterium]
METETAVKTGVWIEDEHFICWNLERDMRHLIIRTKPTNKVDWIIEEHQAVFPISGEQGRYDLRNEFPFVIEINQPKATKGSLQPDMEIPFLVALMPKVYGTKDGSNGLQQVLDRDPEPEEMIDLEWHRITIKDPNAYLPEEQPGTNGMNRATHTQQRRTRVQWATACRMAFSTLVQIPRWFSAPRNNSLNGVSSQTTTTDNLNKPATIKNESNESKPDMNTPEKYSVSRAGSTLTASNMPPTVVDVSVRLMCGTSVTSAPFLATSQGGILITNGSLTIDDVFRKMNLFPGQYDGKQFDLVVTPMTSDASTIEETRILVQGDELVKLLAPTAGSSTPPISDLVPPQPAPKPAPTLPPPAPEKSPEEKLLDAQRSRLELLKGDLNPDLPNGKKLTEQEWSWLSNAYGTAKSILYTLQNSPFANSEHTQKLIAETAELQKEINRTRIGKWGKWPELRDLLKDLGHRIHTLGDTEGQPGFALKGELQQIEDSVHNKHWDSLEVGALFKALCAGEALGIKVVKAEDEAIARSAQIAQEVERQRAENKRQTEENEKLRSEAAKQAEENARLQAELDEARKKAAQPPSPNTPPAPKVEDPKASVIDAVEVPPTPAPEKAGVKPPSTPEKSHSSQGILIVLIVAVILLVLLNIMSLLNDRKWTSDTVPGGTVASMNPLPMGSQSALLADPRARAFFEAFAQAGMVGVTNTASYNPHSIMNSNSIGGHNLVNGSIMINYTMPQTNQPIIIWTNSPVTATNAAVAPDKAPTKCGPSCHQDHTIKKHCSYDASPIPGATRTADGSWIFEKVFQPGDDTFEYRVDPDAYKVTVSYTSCADPSLTVFDAIDRQGSYIPIPIGVHDYLLPAGMLGHRCGVQRGAGGTFRLTLIAQPKVWNTPGNITLASITR